MNKSSSFTRKFSGIVVVLLVGTGLLLAGSGPTRYRIEDLGTFGGPDGCEEGVHQTWASANRINESGDVVGWAEKAVQLLDPDSGEPLYYPGTGHAVCTLSFHAALWRNGEIIDLGRLEGEEAGLATANGLNDHGHVVGQARPDRQTPRHPFLWTDDDGMVDLWAGSTRAGTSWGINNFGEITIIANGAYFRAVNGDERVIRFPDSPGDGDGEAREINDDGIVAGFAYSGGGRFNAFRYDSAAEVVENIHDPFYIYSQGYGVNDQGDIAVRMVAYNGPGFASVWTQDNRLVVLPLGKIRYHGELRPDLLRGGVDDVNALGDVIGVDNSAGSLPAVPWIAFDVLGDGPIEKIALDDLLSPEDQAEWKIHWAWAMNDARQLVGYADHNGRNRAFIMTPDHAAFAGDTGSQAVPAPFPGAGPGGTSRKGVDPLTGLEGVTSFVPDGMGPNRVVGSLGPPSAIESVEPDAVERNPEVFDRYSNPATRDDG